MSHGHTDGTLVVAQLKRRLLGSAAVYKDVTIRRGDGSTRNLGTILVLDDMRDAMVPGSQGRFYHYDVLGSKGVHGFRPVSGRAHARFPLRWDIMCWGIGLLNLLVVAMWLMLNGSYAYWASAFAIIGVIMGVMFTSTRIAAMKAYGADDAGPPGSDELRAVIAQG
jgi:hypothetical protein